MFSFSKLTSYELHYEEDVTKRTKLTAAELATIDHVEITKDPIYDRLSCAFFLKNGGKKFITVSRASLLSVGDKVDPADCTIMTLKCQGKDDIYRIVEDSAL